MKIINSNLKLNERELEQMREKGYDVDIHSRGSSDWYINCISVSHLDIEIGFFSWLSNLACYINQQRIFINNKKHLDSIFNIMDNLLILKNNLTS